MKKQAILTLAFLGFLAAMALIFLKKPEFVSEEIDASQKLVFPNLQADEIHTIAITNRFGTLTLKKQGEEWLIQEKDNYLAETSILNEILSILTELTAVQTTVIEKSQWAKIGVQDPSLGGEEGSGCRVDLSGSGGYSKSIIVGNLQASESQAAIMFGNEFDGRNFIRIPESNQIFLVESSLSFFNTIPSKWIKNILSNPRAYKRITYVEQGERLWTISRNNRSEPYLIDDPANGPGTPLPNLTTNIDYSFASIFIKDVFPETFERSTVNITGNHYFELEALDGFTQRFYLGGKTQMTAQERMESQSSTGVLRKVRKSNYRYAFIEWLNERIDPPPNEPPYSGRTYLIQGLKMDDFLINRDEMLVLERLSPTNEN